MQLENVIIERIRKNGPISFRDYMEMCLYYPELGYYTSQANPIGKNGDYYTSPALSNAFGAMIARQIEEMYEFLEQDHFTIVEFGAGTGMLCQEILRHLKNNRKLYRNLHYCIIERSPVMQEREKKLLREKVSWHDNIDELAPFSGCVISNELIDNLSVHQVIMNDQLQEVFVDYQDKFVEVMLPASRECRDYLEELHVTLPQGYRTEINLDAIQWIKGVESAIEKGWVITIDYGFTAAELYDSSRKRGTIVCYKRHMINDCPYEHIGKQDITTHVNFSALNHWGAQFGLTPCGLINQANFLLNMGLEDYFSGQKQGREELKQNALVKHILLFDMGSRFKVLLQEKGVRNCSLTGLKSHQYIPHHSRIDPSFI